MTVGAAEKPDVEFLAADDMNDWIGCLQTKPYTITLNHFVHHPEPEDLQMKYANGGYQL